MTAITGQSDPDVSRQRSNLDRRRCGHCNASKLRDQITQWHSATSQKNEFLNYTAATPQNAYMYSSCSSLPPFSPYLSSVFLSKFHSSAQFHWAIMSCISPFIIPRQSSYFHSLFSHSPSLFSSPQCSSHSLLHTSAPHPLCSLLHFSILYFLLSSTSCVFVHLCHLQRHFVLVIQFSSALHCKSVNTNSRSQLSVWRYILYTNLNWNLVT